MNAQIQAYSKISDGLDTPGLTEAKALLEQMV